MMHYSQPIILVILCFNVYKSFIICNVYINYVIYYDDSSFNYNGGNSGRNMRITNIEIFIISN